MIRSPLTRKTPLRRVSAKRKAQRLDYEQAKRAAADRDGSRCRLVELWPEVVCAGPMHPHHIGTVRMYPELRCDPDNLLTVCAAHHRGLHLDTRTARKRGVLR